MCTINANKRCAKRTKDTARGGKRTRPGKDPWRRGDLQLEVVVVVVSTASHMGAAVPIALGAKNARRWAEIACSTNESAPPGPLARTRVAACGAASPGPAARCSRPSHGSRPLTLPLPLEMRESLGTFSRSERLLTYRAPLSQLIREGAVMTPALINRGTHLPSPVTK